MPVDNAPENASAVPGCPARGGDSFGSSEPILVEVTRGDLIESTHRAAVAVAAASGRIVLQTGDIDRPIYPRSAIKPLQALPLLETGAADAFAVTDAEIALACASHSGEARHVATVNAWLARMGCTVDDLECGSHPPYSDAAARSIILQGAEPTPAHNNCSGKHTGFLTVARHLGYPIRDYIRSEHPVQRRVQETLESMSGLSLTSAPHGIDGCGIPVIGMPLKNLARAMAALANPHHLPTPRRAACSRICDAMAAQPFMVAGSGRFCSEVIAASEGRTLIKVGAEGVYCCVLRGPGLGIALKVADGATRAAEVIVGRLLRLYGAINSRQAALLADLFEAPVKNRAGVIVGAVRIAASCPF